ncbi:MAG: hypothetical protein CFE24_12370 [Flavobacterium sp. BFFFF2]|nr:MAG: hypothetical protein CFE24_12370 [Flavobacterium sp. BFFFF2]
MKNVVLTEIGQTETKGLMKCFFFDQIFGVCEAVQVSARICSHRFFKPAKILKPWRDFRLEKLVLPKAKMTFYAGQKGPFFWFVFFGPAKKMNNVVSIEICLAESKTSYEKQY